MKVTIIGLGYVGLPLASLSSLKHEVIGFDIDEKKNSFLNNKICPINDIYTKTVFSSSNFKATSNPDIIKDSQVIVICVPTPIDTHYLPNLEPLKGAAKIIAKNLKAGQLIIIESTIYPGTTQEIVIPILEESGLKAGFDFGIAYCPERIDPGNEKWTLANIPRVLGALRKEDALKAEEFYASFIDAPITTLNSIKSAEAVKILENTFRDINIAFINEMAKSFDNLGIDLIEVIKGATTKPFGFMPFHPGPGVGGHCIPVDPYYLIERAKMSGFTHHFLDWARKINLSMPSYVVDVVQEELNLLGAPLRGAKIGVLGCAYKKNIDDFRESPALKIIELLKRKKADIIIYDPYIPQLSTAESLKTILSRSDIILLLTEHSEFTQIAPQTFKENNIKLIVDTRNCLDQEKIKSYAIDYRGIGRGAKQ